MNDSSLSDILKPREIALYDYVQQLISVVIYEPGWLLMWFSSKDYERILHLQQ